MSSSFEQFPLCTQLQTAIQTAGYSKPTLIQNEVIPFVLSGRDVIAKSHTGSGKTAAFCLPALQLLLDHPDKTILIVTPTRELALQVCNEMHRFSQHFGITPAAIYGGEPLPKQLQRLKNDSRILVGTPGRLLDLFRSKHLRNFSPLLVVLDEADEMLNMGFFEDIQAIFSFVPKERQTLLFSATISPYVKKVSKQFLRNPEMIDHSSSEFSHDDIDQIYYLVSERQRKLALLQIIKFHAPTKSIIFCNTKRQVDELSSELNQLGFSVLCLHGDMTQKDRQNSIESFRKSTQKILVATDVAGRGIHVTDVSHVFNYDIPNSLDGYTHRIGRTGRMGNKGKAITLVTPKESYSFKRLLQTKNREIHFSPLPSPDEVKIEQQKRFAQMIQDELIHSEAHKILSFLQQEHSLEEIALRLISQQWKKEAITSKENLHIPTLHDAGPRKKKRTKDFRPKKFRGKPFRKKVFKK